MLTTRRRNATWVTSIATISALCACLDVAHADGNRTADELFERGIALAATQPARACEAFEASNRLDPRAGTSINIGLCRERLGQLASAWRAFKEALRRVKDPEKKRLALQRIAAIEPRVSSIKIVVADVARAPTITLDGELVDARRLGTPIRVDGGRYTIEATLPGHEAWKKTIEISNERSTEVVDVPDLPKVEPPSDKTGPDEPVTGMFTERRKVAIVFGALGAAAVGGGIAFGHAAATLEGNALQLCSDPAVACADADRANGELERARANALYANIGFGVGAALVFTGIVVWVTGGYADDDRIAIAPFIGKTSGVDVQVRF